MMEEFVLSRSLMLDFYRGLLERTTALYMNPTSADATMAEGPAQEGVKRSGRNPHQMKPRFKPAIRNGRNANRVRSRFSAVKQSVVGRVIPSKDPFQTRLDAIELCEQNEIGTVIDAIYLLQRKIGLRGDVELADHPTVPNMSMATAKGIAVMGYNGSVGSGKLLTTPMGIGETQTQACQHLFKALLSDDPRRFLNKGQSAIYQNVCFVALLDVAEEARGIGTSPSFMMGHQTQNVPVYVKPIPRDQRVHPYYGEVGDMPTFK